MGLADDNRFQTFFQDEYYRLLKNELYNYRLRKKSIEQMIYGDPVKLVLEVGSGLSPIITKTDRVVYAELSFTALELLRSSQKGGLYVVADATRLPFKENSFSHMVYSEVLEHIEADNEVAHEMAHVMIPGGFCTITFPHRKAYFSADDRLVNHFRRYELQDISNLFSPLGLQIQSVRKVLGPIDKLAWIFMTAIYILFQKKRSRNAASNRKPVRAVMKLLVFTFRQINRLAMVLAWCETRIIPRSMATVLLVKATSSMDGNPTGKVQ